MKKELKERVENALNELEAIKKELNKPTELKNGKVYKMVNNESVLVYKNRDRSGFGFMIGGEWNDEIIIIDPKLWTEATDEEWLESLKKEVDRKGFKDGNYKCLADPNKTLKGKITGYALFGKGILRAQVDNGSYNVIMKGGVWAEVVKPKSNPSIINVKRVRDGVEYVRVSSEKFTLELNPDDTEYLRNWLNELNDDKQ